MFEQIGRFLKASIYEMTFEQFAIDFIEENYGKFYAEPSSDPQARENQLGAFQYQVETVLEMLNPKAKCYSFFKDLSDLLQGNFNQPNQEPAVVFVGASRCA